LRIAGLARLLRGYAQVAFENQPLWHERDISHSSAERVILPDATALLDYMLVRMTGLIEGLAVRSERMREKTRADFARTQSLGVSGFPTLGVVHGARLYLVTSGYVTDDVLEYRLAEIERLVAGKAAAE